MANYGAQGQVLNNLRTKVRLDYLYYALALIAAITIAMLVTQTGGVVLATLTVLMYFFLVRRDLTQYQDKYTEYCAINSASRYLDFPKYRRKCSLSFMDVAEDGALPINNIHGITRHCISAVWQGKAVSIQDVSYIYQLRMENKRRRAIHISGWYGRIELKVKATLDLVMYPQNLLPLEIAEEFYQGQGFVQQNTRLAEGMLCFVRPNANQLSQSSIRVIQNAIKQLRCCVIMKIEEDKFYALVLNRYIAQSAPDIKRCIDTKDVSRDIFPELQQILRIAATLNGAQNVKERNEMLKS